MANEILDRAFQSHQAGDLAAAAAGYEASLGESPGNPIAQSLLNLIRLQMTLSRMSKMAALASLRHQGWYPGTVFDVGAQVGTVALGTIFPDAHHLMIEPVVECEPALAAYCGRLKNAEYRIAAVAERSGQATLWVSETRQYSGVVTEPAADGRDYRTVPSVSLNDLCAESERARPYLVKVDVDGLEVEVLRGASALMLPDTVFVVEATLHGPEPRFQPILDFFRPYDFVLHDIIDPLHRPLDEALWQVDVVMVHVDSRFRQIKGYG